MIAPVYAKIVRYSQNYCVSLYPAYMAVALSNLFIVLIIC